MFSSSTKQSSSPMTASSSNPRGFTPERESTSQIYDPSDNWQQSRILGRFLNPTLRTSDGNTIGSRPEGSSIGPNLALHHNHGHAADLREWIRQKVREASKCGYYVIKPNCEHDPLSCRLPLVHKLSASAHLLQMTWDAIERMNVPDLDCLRIVQQCADTVIHVREKIERPDAGQDRTELSALILQLESSLKFICETMEKRASSDDDADLNNIRQCDALLGRVVSLLETPAVPPLMSTDAVHYRFRVVEDVLSLSRATEDGKDIFTQDGSSSVQFTPVRIYTTQRPRMENSPAPRQRDMSSHASSSNFDSAMSGLASFPALSATGQVTRNRDGDPSTETASVTEKIYRLRAGHQHDFHESLTLFLWDPTPVEVGAVGFLLKSTGRFVTLFNAMTPEYCDRTKIKTLSSLGRNGNVAIGADKSDSRTLVHKAYDFVSGSRTLSKILTTVSTRVGSKRHTLRLKAGQKTAYMHAEITEHHYFEDLQSSKEWLKDNIDQILSVYASDSEVTKETLMLVTGTLRTPNYGLFVSHNHPDGRAKFKVYPKSSHGQPWGVFTTVKGTGKCGPRYPDTAEDVPFDCHSKVSCIGDPWSTVLIAPLQFRPGATEPALH